MTTPESRIRAVWGRRPALRMREAADSAEARPRGPGLFPSWFLSPSLRSWPAGVRLPSPLVRRTSRRLALVPAEGAYRRPSRHDRDGGHHQDREPHRVPGSRSASGWARGPRRRCSGACPVRCGRRPARTPSRIGTRERKARAAPAERRRPSEGLGTRTLREPVRPVRSMTAPGAGSGQEVRTRRRSATACCSKRVACWGWTAALRRTASRSAAESSPGIRTAPGGAVQASRHLEGGGPADVVGTGEAEDLAVTGRRVDPFRHGLRDAVGAGVVLGGGGEPGRLAPR